MLLKVIVLAIIVGIFGLIFFDIGFITSHFIKPNQSPSTQSQSTAHVSGTIKLNGPIPQGSSISIGVRDHGSSGDYIVFAYGMAPSDDMPWQYTDSKEGMSYEFVAYLDINNKVAFSSNPLTVTAPATEEILTLNIESTNPSPQPATISGTVYINGYIPQGGTFDIIGRPYGSVDNFNEAVDNLPAIIKRTITYSNALAGQKYEIKGQLFDKNGVVVGSSGLMVISAPSDNLEMTINSAAQPPAGAVTQLQNNTGSPNPSPTSSTLPTGSSAISGTINFNGSAPSGSTIVILAAPQGTSNDYQTVVNGISPTNGTVWTWNGASAGTTYNMVAVLKGQTNSQNIDYADSQTYTVAAPAQNQLFTINTGIQLGQPTGSVWITCGTKTNNVWNNNTVNFTNVSGAQYYSFQVGSTSGGTDIANVNQAAGSAANQTINVSNLNDSVTYYAQYAVSSVTNPTPAQYSPYSGAYTLKCP